MIVTKILGIAIIAVGVLGLVYGGFRVAYPDEIVDAGPVHLSVEKHKTVLIPPVLGAIGIACGAALLLAGNGKSAS